jgi:hypothetical protein
MLKGHGSIPVCDKRRSALQDGRRSTQEPALALLLLILILLWQITPAWKEYKKRKEKHGKGWV